LKPAVHEGADRYLKPCLEHRKHTTGQLLLALEATRSRKGEHERLLGARRYRISFEVSM